MEMMEGRTRNHPGKSPRVSFIIGNYNGEGILSECIDSILKQTFRDYEIIMVDDASRDDSVLMVESKYPQVIILENVRNRGLPYSMNRGFHDASGEWIAFLNNDVVLKEDWLERMLENVERWEGERIFASHLLFYYDPEFINSTGGILNLAGYAWDRGIYLRDGEAKHPPYTFYPCGAAMLVHRELLEEVGPFDRRYKGYYEDVELGWRAHLLGYHVIYVPDAVALHRFSFSMGRLSPRKLYLAERNRLRAICKNFENETLKSLRGELVHLYLERMREMWEVKNANIMRRLAYLLRMLQALLWNLIFFPDTLRERKKVAGMRRVRDLDLIANGYIWNALSVPRMAENLQMRDYRPADISEIKRPKKVIGMKEGDEGYLGRGWHNRLCAPDGTYFRWTEREAVAWLLGRRPPRELKVSLLYAHPAEPSRLRISANGVELGRLAVEKLPSTYSFKLPREVGEKVEVRIVVENPFSPPEGHQADRGGEYGVAVSRLEIR